MSWLKRREQKELTKKRIFEASLSLFIEKGYENISIDHIVGSLGLTKGAFYHHFVSKDAIILEFYNNIIQELVEDLLVMVKSNTSHKSDVILELIFEKISGFYLDKFTFLQILLSPSVNSNVSLGDVFIDEISTVLLYVLQLGENRGEYKLFKPAKDVARYIGTLLFYEVRYLCMKAEVKPDAQNISTSFGGILQAVTNGIFISK